MVHSFVFSLEWPLTQSTIVLLSSLISSINFLVLRRHLKYRRSQVLVSSSTGSLLSLFCFPSLVSSTRVDKMNVTSSLRERSLRHQLYPVVPFTRPHRHRCVPLYSSVVESQIVLPPLIVIGVRLHLPRTSVSPPSSGSPSQNRRKCPHVRNVSIVDSPFHG